MALVASGAAITATPARAATGFTGTPTFVDSFLPPSGNSLIEYSIKLEEPYITADGNDKGKPAKKIWARFTKDKSATTKTYSTANVTQPAAVTTIPNPHEVVVKGSVPVSVSDTPSDKWQLELALSAPDATAEPTADWKEFGFTVAPATKVTNIGIDPNPVTLKSGTAVDVGVRAVIEKGGGETIKDVRAESKSTSSYYSMTTGLEADEKSYYDYVAMDYSSPAGSWQVNFTITRGTKTYHFVKGFEVRKGTAAKAKSKVTFAVKPAKVKKGKSVKMYGTVYRGYTSWGPWKKKILKLYFKKKGTSKWKFVTYIGANNSGKFTKSIKPKYDGYWRVGAFATSLTLGKWSSAKFVDVR